jgi:hypothetical protein
MDASELPCSHPTCALLGRTSLRYLPAPRRAALRGLERSRKGACGVILLTPARGAWTSVYLPRTVPARLLAPCRTDDGGSGPDEDSSRHFGGQCHSRLAGSGRRAGIVEVRVLNTLVKQARAIGVVLRT